MNPISSRLFRLFCSLGCSLVLSSYGLKQPRENPYLNIKSTESFQAASKEIIQGFSDWNNRLAIMRARPEDIYYVKFYKDTAGRLHGRVTRDYEGNNIVFELGLVSWAPETVNLARRTNQRFGDEMGSHFNIHGLQTRTSLGIRNFMQIHNGFALHAPIWQAGPLQHNGFIDPSGHGCVRITEHQRLYDLAKSLDSYLIHGQGLPILVDYSIFIDVDSIPPSEIIF